MTRQRVKLGSGARTSGRALWNDQCECPPEQQGCYNEAGSYAGKVLKDYMHTFSTSGGKVLGSIIMGAEKGDLVSADSCAKAAYHNG